MKKQAPGGGGQFIEGLRFEAGALGHVPNAHEIGRIGLRGQPLLAEPMDAGGERRG